MAMTLRADKGAILSWNEMDANFKACMGVHNLLHVQDQKPAGTSGGSFTTGAWRTRTLNTILVNKIIGSSLGSNRITLPSGAYYFAGKCIGTAVNAHACRIYNITLNTYLAGFSTYAYASSYAENTTSVYGIQEITAQCEFEFQHTCSTTNAYGFGQSSTISGVPYNVFADLKIWKLA